MKLSSQLLLDTDTLLAIFRRHAVAVANARAYLHIHQHFTFSIITRYEILRGLQARHAVHQQRLFDQFCAANTILPLSDGIVIQAAKIYAEMYRHTEFIGDADMLIAATALVAGYGLVTNNERYFAPIRDLTILNWLKQ